MCHGSIFCHHQLIFHNWIINWMTEHEQMKHDAILSIADILIFPIFTKSIPAKDTFIYSQTSGRRMCFLMQINLVNESLVNIQQKSSETHGLAKLLIVFWSMCDAKFHQSSSDSFLFGQSQVLAKIASILLLRTITNDQWNRTRFWEQQY